MTIHWPGTIWGPLEVDIFGVVEREIGMVGARFVIVSDQI